MSASFQDHYAVLGVSRDASTEEIQKAYRRLIREAHPDYNPDDEERAKSLNYARDVLCDPEQRQRFDAAYAAELEAIFSFSPSTVDFGDAQEDEHRKTVEVRVYFDPDRILPGEEVDFDSEFGSFWRIAFRSLPSGDDPESSIVFYDLTFSVALQPDVSGEQHENLYLVSDRGVVGKLPLRINIVAAPATSTSPAESASSAAYDPAGYLPDPTASGSGYSAGATSTARRKWAAIKRGAGPLLVSLLLIGGGYFLVTHWNTSIGGGSSGHAANGPFPADAPTLPQTASTAFNVKPRFADNGSISNTLPVTGSLTTNAGEQVGLTIQPSYSSFELTLQVDATSTGSSADVISALQNSVMAVSYPASAPLDFSNVEYKESPLRTTISGSGTAVSGTFVFAAVLPGSYGIGFSNGGYIGIGNVAAGTLKMGNQVDEFSRSSAINGSDADPPNSALVAYMASYSSSDTVISYGAMGSGGSGMPTLCLTTASGSGAGSHKAVTTTIDEQDEGNGSWFKVGTMTFPVPYSDLGEQGMDTTATLSYGCSS